VNVLLTIGRDDMTDCRVGRCGDWYVRVRRGGASFDLALPPFDGWDDAKAEFTGLTLDQTARLLGVPQGDLYEWGRG